MILIYHFGSITTRKNKNVKQIRGDVTFLKKWGITTSFFKKYYLRSRTVYKGPLNEPNKDLIYYISLIKSKFKLIYVRIFS